jgi:sulfite reductase alpha subunit-like flavoprotein
MVDNDSKNHFNKADVIKSEKTAKRKHGKKIAKVLGETQDDFEINLEDSRFASIVQSHDYSIDPTNPHYKKTKAMQAILSKRRNITERTEEGKTQPDTLSKKSALSQLVQSVKRKVSQSSTEKGKRQKK